jgi:hypothetical protein
VVSWQEPDCPHKQNVQRGDRWRVRDTKKLRSRRLGGAVVRVTGMYHARDKHKCLAFVATPDGRDAVSVRLRDLEEKLG